MTNSNSAIASADWIMNNLDDPEIIFLHVGATKTEYHEGHLLKAVWADGYGDFTTERNGIRALAPEQQQLESTLGRMGILGKNGSQKIVCMARDISPWPYRAYWVLKYFGVENVSIAATSVAAMEKIGFPTTTSEIDTTQVICEVDSANQNIIVDQEDVLAVSNNQKTGLILDCRSSEEYLGLPGEHPATRYGRIPGASHLNWEDLLDEDAQLLDTEQLITLYAKSGVDGNTPVYPYCGGGIRSAVSWFVMSELLGWTNTKNYDGSWAEWSYLEHLPIEAN
jgi:thiosulfate/3-mercaptopyruvate sulfurtransferase